MKLLIVSDLHVFREIPASELEPSYIKFGDPTTPSKDFPIASMNKFLEDRKEADNELAVDLVLSPGDLGDKAQAEGVSVGWGTLNELARQLNARVLAATSGNHDVIRGEPRDASVAHLKALYPPFPCRENSLADQYWQKGYCLLKWPDLNVAILDTCYHHKDNTEAKRGLVSISTIDDLVEEADKTDDGRLNILLCHHHPHLHENLGLGTSDVMANGSILLERLGRSNRQWLVIHGHKHHGKVSVAAGGAMPPIVFSAGSFAAKVGHPQINRISNQFYILDVEAEANGSRIRGRFESYTWIQAEGWTLSQVGRGLPGHGGFGWHGNIDELANIIAESFSAEKAGYSLWDLIPDTQYLLPQDIDDLQNRLRKKGVNLTISQHGIPILLR